jgi:hypothetical protein
MAGIDTTVSLGITCNENGWIYRVPKGTQADLNSIRDDCIDSVEVIASSEVNLFISTSDQNGIYELYAVDGSGFISEPETFEILGVGIDKSISNPVTIYPNPFNSVLYVEMSNNSSICSIELSDIMGRTVRRINNFYGNRITIHRDNLPAGIYFLRIHSDKTYVKKLLIR